MTVADLAEEAHLKPRDCAYALGELLEIGLIELVQPDCYFIPKFAEKTATSAERTREWRDRNKKKGDGGDGHSDDGCDGRGDGHGDNASDKKCDGESIESRDKSKDNSVSNDTAPAASRRKPRGERKPKGPPDTSWIEPLRDSARSLADKRLSDLTPDERFVLARYHCWRWANCTQSERVNKTKASAVAAGIAGLATDYRYGQLMVKDYVAHAQAVWEGREKTPFFDPWLIKSRVEFEAAS